MRGQRQSGFVSWLGAVAANEMQYMNRRAFQIENNELRVTVTLEGGHVAEILDKRTGVNPLWTPPWPSIEPSAYSPTRHLAYGGNSESKLLAGILGHNLCLDIFGPPSEEEYAAGWTVHGESSVAPYEITAGEDRLTARVTLPLAQMEFERSLQLAPGGVVRFRETVTNLTAMDRPIAWTQHVTLGPPFIEKGVTRLEMPARKSMVWPGDCGPDQRYRSGAEFDWPHAPNKDGSATDLSVFPAFKRSSGVTCHVVDPDREVGFFLAWHPGDRLLFGYAWKRADFPWISLWEENCSRQAPPWGGKAITRGVEFGVTPFAEGRRTMIERHRVLGEPTYRWLPARGRLSVDYCAFAREAAQMPAELPAGVECLNLFDF